MNATHLPGDLPVLTDIIAADGATIVIPTLTEVVPSRTEPPALEFAELAPPIDFHPAPAMELVPVSAESEPVPAPSAPALPDERNISPAEMQLILDHFTTHLESVFTEKLDRHLQQLHHQAIRLAILELKAELPELLHDLLHPAER